MMQMVPAFRPLRWWREICALAALFAVCSPTRAEDPSLFLIPLEATALEAPVEDADLGVLSQWLGNAHIVGLGESEHGAHEFHALSHRIFAYLAQELGFKVFALEIGQAFAAQLDRFVQGEDLDLDPLLREGWWASKIFYDQALQDLLLWMREYNQTTDHRVHVAGFDFKHPGLAMRAVRETLEHLDPQTAELTAALYAEVMSLGGWGVYPNVYGYTADLAIRLPPEASSIRRLAVTVNIRSRGVSHGWVGLSLADQSTGAAAKHRWLGPDKLAEGWHPASVEIQVPSTSNEISLTVFHRGNGTVWFSNPQITHNDAPLDLDLSVEEALLRPLSMPNLQIMDYTAQMDPTSQFGYEPSLRVVCNPDVDEALGAARQADSLLRQRLDGLGDRLTDHDRAQALQWSRLVLQTVEWRTLVETNRDVFMAENIGWLQTEGFPDSRLVTLAHSYHSGRYPGKMGFFLDERFGDDYLPITMLTLSGSLSGFGEEQSLQPDAPLEIVALGPESAPLLARHLATMADGDLLFLLARARQAGAGVDWLEKIPRRDREAADIAILVRRVGPRREP